MTTTPISYGWDARYQHRQHNESDIMVKLELLEKQYQYLYQHYQSQSAAFTQSRTNSEGLVQMNQSLELNLDMEKQLGVEKELRCQVLQNTLDAYEGKGQPDRQQAEILTIIAKLTNMLHVPPFTNGNEGHGSLNGQ